ncbi:MAG: tetratricopeptide repeat protein [Lachnospiraceae bacterium]|nr:tetratricopeptide repeat protein [Lachnospiraceae bacterium]
MEKIREHKWHILFPIILAIAVLLLSIPVSGILRTDTPSRHISLGKQYLVDQNYAGAVMEFTDAVSMDPGDRTARFSLAEAYQGMGDFSSAENTLLGMTSADHPDEEVAGRLIRFYEEQGNPVRALQTVQSMIDYTDGDDYYSRKAELLKQIFDTDHPYSEGTSHALAVSGGKVNGRGSNTLGQLGTSQGLFAQDQASDAWSDAAFSGSPKKVYAIANSSYVIDDTGNLWGAGANRSGEFALLYGSGTAESGWKQITTGADVLAVSGNSGNLYVLMSDGSLWHSGGGFTQELTRVDRFSSAVSTSNCGRSVYVLTENGDLYINVPDRYDTLAEERFTRIASDVTAYAPDGQGGACYVDASGVIRSSNSYLPQHPADWEDTDNGGVRPDFSVNGIACNGDRILLTDPDGSLYTWSNRGDFREAGHLAENGAIYSEQDLAVAEMDDGTVSVWRREASSPETVR